MCKHPIYGIEISLRDHPIYGMKNTQGVKEGLGNLKKSAKESSIKLQTDLEGDIIPDKKGVFIGPNSVHRKTWTYGLKLFHTGSLYQGHWYDGMMTGEGMMVRQNGWCFKGSWDLDRLLKAEVSFNGVTFYRGQIVDWQLHGNGVYTDSNGNVYDGYFFRGKKNGDGTMKYADGNLYKGNWKDDLKEGDGNMKYANGDVYEGNWKDDKRNGFGVLIYADETRYQGQWRDDLKDGEGALYVKNGDKYEGIWVKDELQKEKVKISYVNKDEYNGEIDVENLQRNGRGTLLKANGDQYIGQWKNDKQHGLGKETFKDQSSFEGSWEGGRQAKGVLTESNGEKFEIEKKRVEKNRKFSSII